jgi:hypothetical protein
MKTEKLIDALVADRATPAKPMRWALAAALLAGGLVSLALFLASLGVRADIQPALGTWRFELKVGLVLLALGLAFSLCIALSRPVMPAHPGRRLLPLAALAALAVAIELLALPSASWTSRLVGSNALVCLVAIPTLAIVPLAAVLAMLRSGAPASPARAGGAAGLLAAAAAAALYAFHCFDDSPLFVVTWYGLAALLVIALGAVAGHRLLRW